MTDFPAPEILQHFGLTLHSYLGGRMNRHWRVHSGDTPLVLRRWSPTADDIDYELRLLTEIAQLGWPVAPAIEPTVQLAGYSWTLFPLLPGQPREDGYSTPELQDRGRLLAELHQSLAQVPARPQRGTWRRCEAILAATQLDADLTTFEANHPEEVRLFRWHLERARTLAVNLPLENQPGIIVHGDFAPWNLLFQDGQLTGILDFEMAHLDHRVGEFSLSWRGRYDEVILAYHEVSPLAEWEWQLITPMWWAYLADLGVRMLRRGILDDGWVAKKLLQRSPLMGPDAHEYR